jgi:sec-independent protein translocase protein TatB
MFDVGFSEMLVIAVVALVVIGPEKLPGVAKTVGAWFGRLQRYVNDVKADINREIELEELRKFKTQFEEAAQSLDSGFRSEVSQAEASMQSIGQDVSNSVDPLAAALDPATLAADAGLTETVAEPVTAPVPAPMTAPGTEPATEVAREHENASTTPPPLSQASAESLAEMQPTSASKTT